MHHSLLLYGHISRVSVFAHIYKICQNIMCPSTPRIIYLILFLGLGGGICVTYICINYRGLKVHTLGTLLLVDQSCLERYMPFLQGLQIRNKGDLLHASFLLRSVFVLYQVESKQML